VIEEVIEAHRYRIWASPGQRCRRLAHVRLDQALVADARTALRSRPVLAFLALEAVAGALFVLRRGSEMLTTVLLIWLGMLTLAFFAWWAGRHRLAHPQADPMPGAAARSLFAAMVAAGMLVWGSGVSAAAGLVLVAAGLGGWLWSALRAGGWAQAATRLARDPRPFVPLLLLLAVPRLAAEGPAFLLAAAAALPSGIGQQLLYLIGLFAPLEALRGRSDAAAVVAALVFGLIHVPLVLDANHGDVAAAIANAVLFQASVGLVACLAYQRHRAAVPIGIAHALAIA